MISSTGLKIKQPPNGYVDRLYIKHDANVPEGGDGEISIPLAFEKAPAGPLV